MTMVVVNDGDVALISQDQGLIVDGPIVYGVPGGMTVAELREIAALLEMRRDPIATD